MSELQLIVDQTAPTPTISGISPQAAADVVNGTITIAGSASDASPVKKVYTWIGEDGVGAPVPVTEGAGWTLQVGTNTWSRVVDTRAPYTDSTLHTVHVVAIDAAGNESAAATANFTIEQSTDKPAVSFDGISGVAEDNVFSTSDSITGTVTDDDGVNTSLVEVSTNDGGGWTAFSTTGITVTGTGKSVGFEYDLSGYTAALTSFAIQVRAADTDPDGAGAAVSDAEVAEFYVDNGSPTLVFTTYTAGSVVISGAANIPGSYLNDSFTLDGTAADDVQVDLVEVKIGAAGSYAAAAGTTSWSYDTGVLSGLSEGALAVYVRATDHVGKQTVSELQLIVDQTAPTITPLSHQQEVPAVKVNKLINISGTASDANIVKKVQWKIDAGAYADATGIYGWSIPALNTVPFGDVIVVLSLKAVDAAGNETEITIDLDVDQSTDLPVINVSNAEALIETTAAVDFQAGQSYFAYGYVADPDGIDITSLEIDVDAGGFNPINLVTDNGTFVSWYYDLSAYGTGLHTITVQADDGSVAVDTNVFEVTSSTANIVSSNARLIGSITDDDGVATGTIEIRIDGGAWVPIDSFAGTSTNVSWEHDLSALPDGPHTAEIRVEDILGETNSSVTYGVENPVIVVAIDTSNPIVAISNPTNGLFTNANKPADTIDIDGTSSDDTWIGAVELSFNDGGGWSAYTATSPTAVDGSYDTWELLGFDTSVYTDGALSIRVRATDLFGYATTETIQINLDRTNPTVQFLTPGVGATVNGAITITGTSSDGNFVQIVEWNKDGGPYTTTDLTGIYGWSIALDTTPEAPGNMDIFVRATDGAGNEYALSRTINIDQSSDVPVVTYSNIDEGAADHSDNLLESNAKIIGNVIDDDGIASIQISFNNGSTWDDVSSPVTISGTSINWYHKLLDGTPTNLGEGEHFFLLRVEDDNWTSDLGTPNNFYETAAEIPFAIDLGAPVVAITSIVVQDPYGPPFDPITISGAGLANPYIFNEYTINGTVTDGNPIDPADMEISLDGGSTWAPVTDLTGSDWYHDVVIDRSGSYDGIYEIRVRATDPFGKVGSKNQQVVVDTQEPTVDDLMPASGSNVNGFIEVRGTASDASPIDSVEMKIGDDPVATYFALAGTYSWDYTFNSSDYADTPDAIDLGGNIWQLFTYVRATDRAGNVKTVDTYSLTVDPDGDTPEVFYSQPDDGAVIGGPVTIYGTATDDDSVSLVEMQIDVNGDGDFADSIDINGANGTADDFEVESSWYAITGTTNWSVTINDNGDWYDDNINNGWIYVRVRATDENAKVSATQQISIRLDSTIPSIANLLPDDDELVFGTFNLTADISDNSRIEGIQLSKNNGISFDDILYYDPGDPGATPEGYVLVSPYDTAGYVTITSITDISLDIPIDTTADFPDTNGVLNYQLKAIDDTTPTPFYTIGYRRFFVDNLYPTAAFDADPQDISTTTALVSGTAGDVGGAISKVEVYFVRGTDFLRPDTVGSAGVDTADMYDAVADAVIEIEYPSSDLYKIIIDDTDELGNDGGGTGDGDGYPESLFYDTGITGYRWSATFDSFNMSDGSLDIHYVVWDGAGNAAHYVEAGALVANFPPTISSIRVGADYDGLSGVVEGEKFDYLAGFTSSNILYFEINTVEANITSYTVYYDLHPYGSPVLVVASPDTGNQMIEEIDIIGPPLNLSDDDPDMYEGEPGGIAGYDGTHFIYEIENDLGVKTIGYITTTIINTDTVDPILEIYPTSRTVDVKISPTGVFYDPGSEPSLDNVVDGEVVLTLNALGDAQGHVELVDDSTYNNAGVTDADVSGIVAIRGYAWDDVGIDEITVQVEGGAVVTVAQWDSVDARLESLVAEFVIDPFTYPDPLPDTADTNTQVINENGHTVEWTYYWDTSVLPAAAITGNDIDVVFTTTDLNSRTAGNPELADRYDVVPYIADVQGSFENGTLQFLKRSALGRYSVQSGETIDIIGYNFDGASTVVSIPGTVASAAPVDDLHHIRLTIGGAAVSDELNVTVGGISSLNNSNADVDYNDEAKTYFPDLDDGRKLSIWENNSITGFTGKTEAVMRPNAGRTGMDWYYVQNGQDVYHKDSADTAIRLTNSWNIKGGDFTRNNDGTFMYLYLHDMNWYSGQDSFQYHGSVQWGKDISYEAAAYNWHRTSTDRLGVGNLSFNNDGNYAYTQKVMSRYENLRILANGTDADTDVFVTYFDKATESRSIVFWSYKVGTAVGGGTNLAGGWTSNLQKQIVGGSDTNYPGGNYQIGIRTPFTGISRSEVTASNQDSKYFAVAYDVTNNNFYIVYYDETNLELKFAYNTDPVNNPGTWTIAALPIDTGAGSYPAMVLDPDGDIHIAYYDSSLSNLKYAYMDDYLSTPEVYTIDALFTNGMYNSITIRDFDATAGFDYRPVISSFSVSFAGTNFALRTAWPTTDLVTGYSDGADSGTGEYTGAWEVVAVSSSTAPGQTNSFIETDGAAFSQGDIVVGYNGSYFEEATLKGAYED